MIRRAFPDHPYARDVRGERMKVTEARELAERLGFRIEKHRGEDKRIIRNLHTDVRVAHGLTFASTVAWLERVSRS